MTVDFQNKNGRCLKVHVLSDYDLDELYTLHGCLRLLFYTLANINYFHGKPVSIVSLYVALFWYIRANLALLIFPCGNLKFVNKYNKKNCYIS